MRRPKLVAAGYEIFFFSVRIEIWRIWWQKFLAATPQIFLPATLWNPNRWLKMGPNPGFRALTELRVARNFYGTKILFWKSMRSELHFTLRINPVAPKLTNIVPAEVGKFSKNMTENQKSQVPRKNTCFCKNPPASPGTRFVSFVTMGLIRGEK